MNGLSKTTSICFVGNFYKTWLFHAVAQKLEKEGVEVCWIVSKQDQYDFLNEHYDTGKILYINRSFINKPNSMIDDFKLNELLFGDRVLKHELNNGLKFLTNIQKPIYDLLAKNKARFIIGEITWAHELLLQRMTKKRTELNCRYLQCSDIRIPNSRFGFFVDENEYLMLEFDQPTDNTEIKMEKPKYLGLIDDMLKKNLSLAGRWNRAMRFFTGQNIEKNDPNVVTNALTRFRIASTEEINKTAYYNRIRTVPLEEIEKEKFIFFGFHKQPENSIDVHGRYYEDQAMVVTNLWRLLPAGWKLVLKEHTNAVGDRSYRFYKNLLRYPNIILANEKINSKLLIERSQLVATVSGTMAYEAALMKKPSITFARVFFNRINSCKQVSLEDLLKYDNLTDLVAELENQADNRLEFSNYLLKNTFEGYVSDSFTDPIVMEDTNIEKIATGFLKLIHRHG
ncbi:MAG: hypothetical protein ABL895_10570 [Cyclobacteriaceae bacterium]